MDLGNSKKEYKAEFKVVSTWLDKKPSSSASALSALFTLILVIGSLIHFNNFWGLQDLLEASHNTVFKEHQFWRLWTTLFAHADPKHLLSNAFMFFVLGLFLIGYFSLFIFPITAFIFGGIINLIVLKNMPENTSLIGMSGVVFWMAGVWLALYFLIDTRRTIWQRFLRSAGVLLVLFMPSEVFTPNISYKSHFVGLVLGLMFGFVYYKWNQDLFLNSEVKVSEPVEDITPGYNH
jgi:rhomboid protease GluP